MHTQKLGKAEITVMNQDEFKQWIADKKVYRYNVGWIEEWKQPVLDYFPYSGFTLDARVTLAPYGKAKYSEKCLGFTTTDGVSLYDLPRFKVTLRKTKKGNKYYATKK